MKANNNLVLVKASFDKQIVSTYDYTTLHFRILPLINFSHGVHYVLLNFSDETLNKIIYLNKDGSINLVKDEEYAHDILLYIQPQAGSVVSLKSVSIVINLNKYI